MGSAWRGWRSRWAISVHRAVKPQLPSLPSQRGWGCTGASQLPAHAAATRMRPQNFVLWPFTERMRSSFLLKSLGFFLLQRWPTWEAVCSTASRSGPGWHAPLWLAEIPAYYIFYLCQRKKMLFSPLPISHSSWICQFCCCRLTNFLSCLKRKVT